MAEGTITETRVDPIGTYLHNNTKLLIRVEKTVDVRYTYPLMGNSWSQFPDMAMEFHLEFAQYVSIQYNIGTETGQSAYLITKMFIDGSEKDRLFTVITGPTNYHSNIAYGEVWLEKGRHFVQVQYHTSHGHDGIDYSRGWPTGILKVKYFQE